MVTCTENVTGPPGSGTLVGDGVLVTSIFDGRSVSETCAVSVSETSLPSSSLPVAVTVSVSAAPALPVNVAVNVHVYVPFCGMSFCGTAHVVAVMPSCPVVVMSW